MKYYERRLVFSILFLLSGLLFLLSSIFQFRMGNYGLASLQLFATILFLFDVYIYRKPYLGLGEGKIVIYSGLKRKEIILEDITLSDQTNKHLTLTYNLGLHIRTQKIELSILKEHDRAQFVTDLHSALG